MSFTPSSLGKLDTSFILCTDITIWYCMHDNSCAFSDAPCPPTIRLWVFVLRVCSVWHIHCSGLHYSNTWYVCMAVPCANWPCSWKSGLTCFIQGHLFYLPKLNAFFSHQLLTAYELNTYLGNSLLSVSSPLDSNYGFYWGWDGILVHRWNCLTPTATVTCMDFFILHATLKKIVESVSYCVAQARWEL